ncbi:MAG: DUF1761 family protein [Boseongicola sp.]|nr:DUF1761 family protein [Boseongicola sp.]NNL19250.1 DUF1761 family protein [Boseongicola sp.]
METEALNIAAVVAGAVAGFLLGMILYHPRVLGTIWADGSGVDLNGSPPIAAFAMQILGLVALAIVVGMTATINFLGTALLAILAAAFLTLGNGAFARKSKGALAVDGLYILGAGVLMIAAQGLL